jgi:hypothetical protein
MKKCKWDVERREPQHSSTMTSLNFMHFFLSAKFNKNNSRLNERFIELKIAKNYFQISFNIFLHIPRFSLN